MGVLLCLFLLQAPGEGWNVVQAAPREVKRVYWELFETTEVWVLLLPGGPDNEPSRVNLVFQAFFPGRAKRDPYSGLPQWPKGEPERITLRVQPFPLTVINEVSLRLVVDEEVFDLGASCQAPGGSGPPCQLLFPCPECFANGLSVEIQPTLLPRLAKARVVTGTALGVPILLTSEDLRAVGELSERIRKPQRSKSRGR
jgi:hypothetical protein